jgi:hypothetical protein
MHTNRTFHQFNKKGKKPGNQKLPLTREHVWIKEGIWSPYPFQPWQILLAYLNM